VGKLPMLTIFTCQTNNLSFGLSASTFQFKLAVDKLKFRDSDDVFNSDFSNKVLVPILQPVPIC
jgi:hypothetical protein